MGAQGTPSDVIASVEGSAPVQRAEFDRWMAIAAARGESTTRRVPDHPEYAACAAAVAKTKAGRQKTLSQRRAQCQKDWVKLRDQVLGFLIAARWVKGETAERGITVTPREVAQTFEDQKEQAFPEAADFRKFLEESGSTEADIRFQVEIELLQQEIVERVSKGVGPVAQADIEAYYRENREEFATPEARDVRVVLTKTRVRALQARRELNAGRSWRSVARRYSIDEASKDRGGRLVGVTKGQQERALDRAVFGARRGQIRGPVRTQFGYYIFKVTRIAPPVQASLKESTSTIKALLSSQNQQRALDAFGESYRARWKARTGCLAGYVIEDCGATLAGPTG